MPRGVGGGGGGAGEAGADRGISGALPDAGSGADGCGPAGGGTDGGGTDGGDTDGGGGGEVGRAGDPPNGPASICRRPRPGPASPETSEVCRPGAGDSGGGGFCHEPEEVRQDPVSVGKDPSKRARADPGLTGAVGDPLTGRDDGGGAGGETGADGLDSPSGPGATRPDLLLRPSPG